MVLFTFHFFLCVCVFCFFFISPLFKFFSRTGFSPLIFHSGIHVSLTFLFSRVPSNRSLVVTSQCLQEISKEWWKLSTRSTYERTRGSIVSLRGSSLIVSHNRWSCRVNLNVRLQYSLSFFGTRIDKFSFDRLFRTISVIRNFVLRRTPTERIVPRIRFRSQIAGTVVRYLRDEKTSLVGAKYDRGATLWLLTN